MSLLDPLSSWFYGLLFIFLYVVLLSLIRLKLNSF